ncbi:hypothetical protein [Noviherbaspirillum aerium]|uniref:hypothetical protein n=1 Tax=Noviherbaspirillum aerium TaxID=2588497 RepID=UPI00178C5C06|nr:hypothetical protein [Noviherbaspirillum aerium]
MEVADMKTMQRQAWLQIVINVNEATWHALKRECGRKYSVIPCGNEEEVGWKPLKRIRRCILLGGAFPALRRHSRAN